MCKGDKILSATVMQGAVLNCYAVLDYLAVFEIPTCGAALTAPMCGAAFTVPMCGAPFAVPMCGAPFI